MCIQTSLLLYESLLESVGNHNKQRSVLSNLFRWQILIAVSVLISSPEILASFSRSPPVYDAYWISS